MAIVSVSSRISRGYIGNTAAAFAARRLGVDVWEVPTVIWPHHPGHGRPAGPVTSAKDIDAMLSAFERADWRAQIDLVMTGYFRDVGQVEATASFIRRIRDARQQFQVLVQLQQHVQFRLEPLTFITAGKKVAFGLVFLVGASGDPLGAQTHHPGNV